MTTVLAENVVRITHTATWSNGRQIATVDHWRVSWQPGVSRAVEVPEFVDAVCTAWQARLVNVVFPDNYLYTGADYLDMHTNTGVSGHVSKNDAGIGAAAQVPPALSIIVNKIAPGTRAQRNGRAFLPTLSEAGVDENGNVDSTTLAQVVAAYALYAGDVLLYGGTPAPVDVEHVLISYDRDSEAPTVNADVRNITGYSGRSLVGRQGRRIRV